MFTLIAFFSESRIYIVGSFTKMYCSTVESLPPFFGEVPFLVTTVPRFVPSNPNYAEHREHAALKPTMTEKCLFITFQFISVCFEQKQVAWLLRFGREKHQL